MFCNDTQFKTDLNVPTLGFTKIEVNSIVLSWLLRNAAPIRMHTIILDQQLSPFHRMLSPKFADLEFFNNAYIKNT